MATTTTHTTTQPPAARTPRRAMPAGVALFVVVGALVMGLLLNAADIRQTAQRQEQGWQRTVAVALVEPIYQISHFLYLDRPRLLLDAALGREPAAADPAPSDPVAAAPAATTSTTVTATTSTTEALGEERRAVGPADPLVMYIGGDSLVGQFGPMLQNRANRTEMVESEVVYEFESGLSRPDFVDWPARLARVRDQLDPDVFVLYFGGNDAQAIYMPDGTWIDYGTTLWEAEYRRRVDEVMTDLEEDGRWVYWMGMPIVQSESFQEKVRLMNSIYESVAADHPMVTYVPAWEVFEGPEGGYSEYLTDSEGNLVDMRLDDGVHYTTNGAIRLAEVVYQHIAEDWGLPPG